MYRGSTWGKWDLHIHTPASYEWNGRRLRDIPDETERDALLKDVVSAMNASDCVAVGVMDYWTFEGVKAIRAYLRKPGAEALRPTLFPGIELRMVSPGDFRLNMHVLLNPRLSDDQLDAFKAQLRIANFDKPLVDANLVEYGRTRVTEARLADLGLSNDKVRASDAAALIAASKTIEVSPESVRDALKTFGHEDAILLIPFDTNDGLKKIQFREHYNFPRELLAMEAIFEVGHLPTRDAFVGIATADNQKFFKDFQAAIQHPKLAVRGSDAHRLSDYGKFPGDKNTWLKAAPTFAGLLQACKEPANRSYIGVEPPKLEFVRRNPQLFVRGIEIRKLTESKEPGVWFDKTNLEFSDDLVAIIGRKGSGKSALADVIGFLGDTPNSEHFSFLSPTRFRLPRDNKAAAFEGRLKWAEGASDAEFRSLSAGTDSTAVERVKYLPQRYFEELCNDHVEGKDDLLQRELQTVIFSHLSAIEREGARSLDELIEIRTSVIKEKLQRSREEVTHLSSRIGMLSERASREQAQYLRRQLDLLVEKLRTLKGQEPALPASPNTDDPAVAQLNLQIAALGEKLGTIDKNISEKQRELEAVRLKLRRIEDVRARVSSFAEGIEKFKTQMGASVGELGLLFGQIIQFSVDFSTIDKLEADTKAVHAELSRFLASEDPTSVHATRLATEKELAELKGKLDEPNKHYQQGLLAHSQWKAAWSDLLGDSQTPGTFWSIWWELEALPLLEAQLNELRRTRVTHAKQILGAIQEIAAVRAELYRPVQELVDIDADIREHLHVEFSVNLSFEAFAVGIFDYVKQSAGSFVGSSESKALVNRILNANDLTTEDGLERFLADIETALSEDVRGGERRPVSMDSILRSDKKAENLFNYIYQLEYVELAYGLSMSGVSLERLSPGQRGALLLIFYLLVDRDRIPIVLDQPEENLDNETVFRLLVNVINKAKQNRQVIMITHNANLAVACDAEQIICCDMDRDGQSRITYQAGAIEELQMNRVVVDVLEGTKRAFDNRSRKYA